MPLLCVAKPFCEPCPPSALLCSSAAALITSLVGGVNGQATLSCDAATGACVMKLAGLPIPQINANCQAAECLAAPAPSERTAAATLGSDVPFCCLCCVAQRVCSSVSKPQPQLR